MLPDENIEILLKGIIQNQNKIINDQHLIFEHLKDIKQPSRWLLDEDLESEFNISRFIRNKLIKEKKLTPIKISGTKSKSYFDRIEVEKLFKNH